jgi:hypothetical protein
VVQLLTDYTADVAIVTILTESNPNGLRRIRGGGRRKRRGRPRLHERDIWI